MNWPRRFDTQKKPFLTQDCPGVTREDLRGPSLKDGDAICFDHNYQTRLTVDPRRTIVEDGASSTSPIPPFPIHLHDLMHHLQLSGFSRRRPFTTFYHYHNLAVRRVWIDWLFRIMASASESALSAQFIAVQRGACVYRTQTSEDYQGLPLWAEVSAGNGTIKQPREVG